VVAEYNRVIAEVAASWGALPDPAGPDITITELTNRYRPYGERHCTKPNGTNTGTVVGTRRSCFLGALGGDRPAARV
jgi:hypothetical protein